MVSLDSRCKELVRLCSYHWYKYKDPISSQGPLMSYAPLEEEALKQGVAPLFWDYCVRNPRHFSPVDVKRARAELQEVAALNRLFSFEVVRIVECMRDFGVRAVPFKGVVLTQALYGDISLRESSDIDLYVHPNQFSGAYRVMLSMGFEPSIVLQDSQLELLMSGEDALEFLHPEIDVAVELHCSLAYEWRCSIDPPQIASGKDVLNLGGVELCVLSRESRFLMLCLHASKHQFNLLRYLVDIRLADSGDSNFHRRVALVPDAW